MTTPNTPFLALPCPHCTAPRDLATISTGDGCRCPDCGGWFAVRFVGGRDAVLVACDAPAPLRNLGVVGAEGSEWPIPCSYRT